MTKRLFFKQTCFMCPEQYDVYRGEEQVAYVRLRWGYLTVEVPDVGGKLIYEHSFKNNWQGCFFSPIERKKYLCIVEKKILKYLKSRGVLESV